MWILRAAQVRAILKELAEKEAAVQAGIRDEEERADGGRQGAGRIRTVTSGVKDVGALEDKVDEIGEAVSELSRNVAKKMALMIELMMSLSDQVGQ